MIQTKFGEPGDSKEMTTIFAYQVVKEQIERYYKIYNAVLKLVVVIDLFKSDEDSLNFLLKTCKQKRYKFAKDQGQSAHRVA